MEANAVIRQSVVNGRKIKASTEHLNAIMSSLGKKVQKERKNKKQQQYDNCNESDVVDAQQQNEAHHFGSSNNFFMSGIVLAHANVFFDADWKENRHLADESDVVTQPGDVEPTSRSFESTSKPTRGGDEFRNKIERSRFKDKSILSERDPIKQNLARGRVVEAL
jgi:hypothetical protein